MKLTKYNNSDTILLLNLRSSINNWKTLIAKNKYHVTTDKSDKSGLPLPNVFSAK